MSDEEYFGALPTGYQLEEYRIEAVLGQGGFGITYKARDTNLNKLVAIKEYLPEQFAFRKRTDTVSPRQGSGDDFQWGLQRFLQEAQTLGQFEHLNIVPVLRYFEANKTAYMVMAYQDGQALGEILDTVQILEESELEEIIYPLLDGLETVHRAGVLHRDIKPDNIFIRLVDGTPVLLDFGAARQAIGARHRNVTRIVTPNYAPHEQYHSDGELGPWTDIYAIAAVVYEGITGAPPPEAPARIINDKIVPAIRAGRDRYRRGFLQAIDTALAVRHDRRPQTIAQWRNCFPPPLNPEMAVAPWRHGRLTGALRPGSARLAAAATRSRRLSNGDSPTTRDPQALVSDALADIGDPHGANATLAILPGTGTQGDGGADAGPTPAISDKATAAVTGAAVSEAAAPPPIARHGGAVAPPAPPAPVLRRAGKMKAPATTPRPVDTGSAKPGKAAPEASNTGLLGAFRPPDTGEATGTTPEDSRTFPVGAASNRVDTPAGRTPAAAAPLNDRLPEPHVLERRAPARSATRESRHKRRTPLLWVASGAIVFIVSGFTALALTMISGPDETARVNGDGASGNGSTASLSGARSGTGSEQGKTTGDGPALGAGRDDTDPNPDAAIDVEAVVRDMEQQAEIARRQAVAVAARLRKLRAAAAAKARNQAVAKAFHRRRLQVLLPGRREPTLLRFASSGLLTGSTVSVNASGEDINENGRWWVADSKLCLRLQRWNGGRSSCFRVTIKGRPTGRRVPVVGAGGAGNFSGTLTY